MQLFDSEVRCDGRCMPVLCRKDGSKRRGLIIRRRGWGRLPFGCYESMDYVAGVKIVDIEKSTLTTDGEDQA